VVIGKKAKTSHDEIPDVLARETYAMKRATDRLGTKCPVRNLRHFGMGQNISPDFSAWDKNCNEFA
jgi:hypothetical protein